MNKGFIKFITDFGPLLIFFIFYYQSGLNLAVAIPPLIIATLLSLAIIYLLEKKNSVNTPKRWNYNNIIWRLNIIF